MDIEKMKNSIITNEHFGKCAKCEENVYKRSGFALLENNKWVVYHVTCLNEVINEKV